MPFGQPFDDYYKQILMPAVTSVGLIPVRADEINKPGVIIHQIWQGIKDARVCIADVTGRNANVMYELGLAHAVGKPVIQIVQNIEDLPFDLRAYRHILYETRSPQWANSLGGRLREMLVAAIANSEPLLPELQLMRPLHLGKSFVSVVAHHRENHLGAQVLPLTLSCLEQVAHFALAVAWVLAPPEIALVIHPMSFHSWNKEILGFTEPPPAQFPAIEPS